MAITGYFAEHLLLEHLFLMLSDMQTKQTTAKIAQGKKTKTKDCKRFHIIYQK